MSKRRYFESDSRHKAGVISEELRKALNIHSDKLPIWIYRMRVLGYPPGWLQQAQVNTLSFNDGNNDTEEGEVNDSIRSYNKESLIEYPGFNVPVPKGVKDDWYFLRMPPMLEQQQLKEALKTMKVTEPVPYKRTKLDTTSNNSPSTSTIAQSTPIPTATAQSSHSNSNNSSEAETPIESNFIESALSPIKSTNCSDCENNVFEDSTEEKSTNTPTKPTESSEKSRKLTLISMGSPMPASERTTRPSLEKWSEGMGELLYFENPSEAYTGIYQNKMKGVIQKIRQQNSQT